MNRVLQDFTNFRLCRKNYFKNHRNLNMYLNASILPFIRRRNLRYFERIDFQWSIGDAWYMEDEWNFSRFVESLVRVAE